MGKRSRKRGIPERSGGDGASATSRAERDAARERRAQALARGDEVGAGSSAAARRRRASGKTSFEDRPPAPWGNFPLVEIVVLLGIVLMVVGFFVQGARGATMIVAGLALASLAGLELVIREHFAGFRSHTTLLSALPGVATAAGLFFARAPWPAVVVSAVAVFAAAFWLLRRTFMRRARRSRG